MLPAPVESPLDEAAPAALTFAAPSVARYSRRLGRRLAGAAVALLVVPSLLSTVMWLLVSVAPAWASYLTALLGLMRPNNQLALLLGAFSWLATSYSWPRPAPAAIEVTTGGVAITQTGATRRIDVGEIVEGLILPGSRPTVELRLRRGDVIAITTEEEQHAQALLDALGLDAGHRRVGITLGAPTRPLFAGILALMVSSIPIAIVAVLLSRIFDVMAYQVVYPLLYCLTALGALAVARSYRPIEVVIGGDGVAIRRAWRSRFLPHDAIERVEVEGRRLELRLRGGETEVLSAPGKKPDDAALLLGIAARIREARERRSSDAQASARLELLDRRGRSFAEWRAGLAALLQGTDYRRSALRADDLLATIDDARAEPARRVGAALALRAAGHPEVGQRVRIAAEACASEPLRIALEQAAEGELDEATLARAEAEGARRALP